MTLDEILTLAESKDPRIELLKQGYNAIYIEEAISPNCIMLKPNGKCYIIDDDENTKKNIIIRELTLEEYSKLDLIKGKDY